VQGMKAPGMPTIRASPEFSIRKVVELVAGELTEAKKFEVGPNRPASAGAATTLQ